MERLACEGGERRLRVALKHAGARSAPVRAERMGVKKSTSRRRLSDLDDAAALE